MAGPQAPAPAALGRCVFCARPVAPAERCPLLPSSHWACCTCDPGLVPEEAQAVAR
jgi:hypothetical protein